MKSGFAGSLRGTLYMSRSRDYIPQYCTYIHASSYVHDAGSRYLAYLQQVRHTEQHTGQHAGQHAGQHTGQHTEQR